MTEMIDSFIHQIEDVQEQGAVVLLKWDGERLSLRCTVVITRKDTDYVWRKDCDDITAGLAEALHDYKEKHDHRI
jgi:hypothetical protein